jgi:hypothetical protein
MRATAICVAVLAVLLAGLAYLEFSPNQESFPQSLPPFLHAISTCVEPMPGMRRIGEQGLGGAGLRFDLPAADFTIRQGCSDAPPLVCGFDIRPNNSAAQMNITWGEQAIEGRPPDPILDTSDADLSAFAAKRRVFDTEGKAIGQEAWGYWGQGERWRRVHFLGRVQARYGSKNESEIRNHGSTHEREAALFDQIINTACRLSPSDK